MSLLVPGALLAGLLAVPIIVLYMLKLRRREVQVSSTLLWQMLLRDRQANTPWQRLKRNLLLFLQLLTLAALVFALARPALQVPSVASGSLVVLLDGSASMNARMQPGPDAGVQYGGAQGDVQGRVNQTRFEAARDAVGGLIDGLPANANMTLILVSRQPQTLAAGESDKNELYRALESAQPSQASADWEAAFSLAAGAASASANGQTNDDTTIVIVSDGGLPQESLPPLPSQVRFISVGQGSENLAVSAFALRPAGSSAELFARVTNYGDHEQQSILSIYADGRLLKAQQMVVPAGEGKNLVLKGLPDQHANYEARLSPPGPESTSQSAGGIPTYLDTFDLDDLAFAVYHPARKATTLLVTQKNIFLEQLLASLPGIEPFRALLSEDGTVKLPNDAFDVYILDGVYPEEASASPLSRANLLLVNPPSNDLFEVSGTFTNTANAQLATSPLTEFVDWRNVHVLKARRVQTPDWAQVLVDTPSGPLVFAGETRGRRVAVVTFDLHDSDLPLKVAYPILLSNLIQYLAQAQPIQITAPTGQLHPGDSLTIQPHSGTGEVTITSPSGRVYHLEAGENGATFSQTGEIGTYSVAYGDESNTPVDAFAVNLFSPLESDIHPVKTIRIGSSSFTAASQAEIGEREYWPWLAALALALLLLEWWVYHRRQDFSSPWRELSRRLRSRARRSPGPG